MPKMINVVHVPCDRTQPVTLKQVGQSDLRGYQALVGGPIELVPINAHGEAALFNEEGLDSLPANDRATVYMALRGLTNQDLGYCGDAVFLSLPVGAQEFQDATDAMIAHWLPADTSGPAAGQQAPR